MGRYKTAYTDERGELIRVPAIPDPVITNEGNTACNFCVYNESRDTGELIHTSTPGRCGDDPGHCDDLSLKKRGSNIFIYRHELREYRARAVVAKINSAAHGEEE